jgi:MFS family permease
VTTGVLSIVGRIVRSRALRRVFGAFLLFNMAEFGTWVAVLLYAYDRTGPASVGLVALIQLIPAALIAPPAAGLGDRYPRHRVLLCGYLVQAAAMGLTAVAMAQDAPIVLVYTAAAFAASSVVVTRPTQSALLPSLSETPDELTAANAAAGVIEGTGVLLGPLLAALILTSGTPAAVFGLAAVGTALAAILVATIQPGRPGIEVDVSEPAAGIDRPPESRSFRVGLGVLLADPDARVVVGLLSMRMLIIGAADVLFVLLALEALGMGAPGAAVLNAALGAGTIIGGIVTLGFVGRSRLSMAAAAGAVAWGLALAGTIALGSPALAIALIVAGGAGLAVLDVAGRTILQRSIRDEVLARVFGLQEGLAMGGLAAGALLVPVLVAAANLTVATVVCAALLPVTVALTWSRLTALDARTVVPSRAIALLRQASIFAGLPAPPLEAVARRAVWLTVPPGTEIIRQGDHGDRYYVMDRGRVKVDQDGHFVREIEGPGQGFGEIALLRDVRRTATVTALEETDLLAIDRVTFLDAVTGQSGGSSVIEPGLSQRR